MQGVFDGTEPVAELKKHGDFGIGTFDALDGEMMVLDGKVYQAGADGSDITSLRTTTTTPFATVTYFDRDIVAKTADTDEFFHVFTSRCRRNSRHRNIIYAVKMHANISSS